MNIIITRYRKKSQTIDGKLKITTSTEHGLTESLPLCDTAENALTALPAGKYQICIIKCKQHARKMPVVLIHKDVKPSCEHCNDLEFVCNNTSLPCYCAMLKPGNGVYNRKDGSILVGTYLAPGCLKHPKRAFDAIYDRIRKSAERGHEITLQIIEDYPKSICPDLTPFVMGTRALAQMGGKPLNI